MEIIPITTGIMQPPQDDLWAFLERYVTKLRDGDVLAISSKIVAIGEGRCVAKAGIDKASLVQREAVISIPRSYATKPLTITNYAFISAAGIDESNGDGYYVLLPEDAFQSAARIHAWATAQFGCTKLGVVITDSHSGPFRQGATGIAIGFWGIAPLISHIGKEDLFGRVIQHERSNMVDGIAAASNLVMGETNECQPLAIVRDVPGITFVAGNHKDALFVGPTEDTFRVLYEQYL